MLQVSCLIPYVCSSSSDSEARYAEGGLKAVSMYDMVARHLPIRAIPCSTKSIENVNCEINQVSERPLAWRACNSNDAWSYGFYFRNHHNYPLV